MSKFESCFLNPFAITFKKPKFILTPTSCRARFRSRRTCPSSLPTGTTLSPSNLRANRICNIDSVDSFRILSFLALPASARMLRTFRFAGILTFTEEYNVEKRAERDK